MTLTFQITIINRGDNHVHTMLSKDYPKGFIPPPGVKFEDGAWGEDCKVPREIVVGMDGGYCVVRFDDIELDTEQECQQAENVHLAQGWK